MTQYDKIMQEMTVEQMANLRVRIVILNNSQPFYLTSTGQLFEFNNLEEAVKWEYRYLTTPLQQSTSDTEGAPDRNEEASTDIKDK